MTISEWQVFYTKPGETWRCNIVVFATNERDAKAIAQTKIPPGSTVRSARAVPAP
ncbi:MAG TPA: hypothetical protein VLE97_01000 [Gaiellaceae bacterium]|nr:hypothetical protein [Gaiellaceae bacterium]